MVDNRPGYGFRWAREWNGCDVPKPITCLVATGTAFNVNAGAQGVGLGKGDLVTWNSTTGTVTLCDGSEGGSGTVAPLGVIVGVAPYWDATKSKMVFGEVLPSATAWGTVQARRSELYVVPVTAGLWEVDCDDAVTATTEAAYQAFVGENLDHINAGASGQTRAYPKLDISGHATTDSLKWRIVGISKTRDNKDFSGANVKLIVQANFAKLPEFNVTASGGTGN